MPLKVETDGFVRGRFLPGIGAFIEARTADALRTLGKDETISLASVEGETRPVSLPSDLDDEDFSFLRLVMPGVSWVLGILDRENDERRYWLADSDTRSWARASVRHGRGSVSQGGSRRLWDQLEQTHELWEGAGCPPHERLGLAITRDGHHQLWVDSSSNVITSL